MRTIYLLLAIFLPGCATIATADIDRAIGLATAAKDQQGLNCLNAQRLIFGVEPLGFFTVAEQARLMQSAIGVCAGVIPVTPTPSIRFEKVG